MRELHFLPAGCALVVDCGFSFTHAVPIFDWRVLSSGVRRIDLGGKAMTNWMKEQVSYRCGPGVLPVLMGVSQGKVSAGSRLNRAGAGELGSKAMQEWVFKDWEAGGVCGR